MKLLSRIAMLLLCLTMILSLGGCLLIKYDFSLKQDSGNITKVEFYRYQHDETQPKTFRIMELELDSALKMLEEIKALPAYKHFGDSTTNYGSIIVYVTYSDHTGEVIGPFNTATVDTTGIWMRTGYYFQKEQWDAVIGKYIDLTEGL